jgi:hypothetical protein
LELLHVFVFSFKGKGIKVPDCILQGTISTKIAFSAFFYEKSVQTKDPGNRENGVHGGVRKGGVDKI